MSESITTEFVKETPQPYGEPATTGFIDPSNTLEEAVQVVVRASGRW